MSKFQNYLKTFDITSTLTEEDIDKTLALLQIYGPAVRRTASRIGEMEEECYEGRRQSISDFINLAIDYDRDTDRKRRSPCRDGPLHAASVRYGGCPGAREGHTAQWRHLFQHSPGKVL